MLRRYALLFFLSLVSWISLQAQEMRYLVDPLCLRYRNENPRLPAIDELLRIRVPLTESDLGYRGWDGKNSPTWLELKEIGNPGVNLWFYQSALGAVGKALVDYFNNLGIFGVRIAIGPGEIDAEGDDLRPVGDTALTLYILHAEVGGMRTVDPKTGDIDAARHERIKKNAPIAPDQNQLLEPDTLQEYLFFLNRYPNRSVDIEVTSLDGLGLVGIDFIIDESKPWRLYFNAANTGPVGLNRMQESLGFIHTQVTGHDDIFQIDASTDSFNQFQSVTAYYERPFLNHPRLRWRLQGDEARFSSAQLGFEKEFTGSSYGGRFELNWNGYQRRDFFVDLIAALQYRYIHVHNQLLQQKGQENFVLPNLGIRLSSISRTAQFYLSLLGFLPFNGITGVKSRNLNKLGRLDVSTHWQILEGESYASIYLEALGDEGYSHLANELFVYAQGQTSLGARLIPEYQAVLGGLYSVRGYPTAVMAADSAITGVIEYRLHIPQLLEPVKESPEVKLFGKPFRVRPPYPGGAADWDLILRGFYDIGVGHNRQAKQADVPYDADGTLMGAGVGAELIIRNNLFLRIDNGWALKTFESYEKGHYEFYFSGTIVY